MGLERSVADELVDEEALGVLDAVADEHDDIAVLGTAEHVDLGAELHVAVTGAGEAEAAVLLHGHGLAIGQQPAVHRPEASLRQEVRPREAARRPLQLPVREAARRLPEHGRLVLAYRAQRGRPRSARYAYALSVTVIFIVCRRLIVAGNRPIHASWREHLRLSPLRRHRLLRLLPVTRRQR